MDLSTPIQPAAKSVLPVKYFGIYHQMLGKAQLHNMRQRLNLGLCESKVPFLALCMLALPFLILPTSGCRDLSINMNTEYSCYSLNKINKAPSFLHKSSGGKSYSWFKKCSLDPKICCFPPNLWRLRAVYGLTCFEITPKPLSCKIYTFFCCMLRP